MDIPAGLVRVKFGGGSGGHKGVESIRSVLGTGGFARVRIGIGRPAEGTDPSDWVLEEVPAPCLSDLGDQLERAAEAALMCLTGDMTRAMNTFNRREGPQ